MRDNGRLTAAELDLARLVVHRVLDEHHVTGESQREPLTVEDRAVRRQADQPVRHGDGVMSAGPRPRPIPIWFFLSISVDIE